MIAAYGGGRVDGNVLHYDLRGVSFGLSKEDRVGWIEVYEPRKAAPAAAAGTQPKVAAAGFDLFVRVPRGWKSIERAPERLRAAHPGGAVTLDASACADCGSQLAQRVTALEAELGENRLPAAVRDIDRAWLQRMGADAGYAGVYAKGDVGTWVLVLRRGQRAWTLRLVLDGTRPQSQATYRELAAILANVRVIH